MLWVDEWTVQSGFKANTTASQVTQNFSASSYGIGQGDYAGAPYIVGSSYYLNATSGNHNGSTAQCYLNVKNIYQDDQNEFVYFMYRFNPTTYSPTAGWHLPKDQYFNLVGVESSVGNIQKVITDLQPFIWAYNALASSYGASHVTPAQSNYFPADPGNYGTKWDHYVLSGDRDYVCKPTMYGQDPSKSNYYHKNYYNYYAFDDYWVPYIALYVFEGTGGGCLTTVDADLPYRNNWKSYRNIKNVMFGKKINYYIGTLGKREREEIVTNTYASFRWGPGTFTDIEWNYVTLWSYAYGAKGVNKPEYYNNICATNSVITPTPNYYTHGHIKDYKNSVLALVGEDVGFCDGAPLFRASLTGLAHLKLKINRSSGAPSNIQVNIKEDKFTNDTIGNGNTLKYCNSNGVEIGYLQNKTPDSTSGLIGSWDLYFPVQSGKVYWIKVSPQDSDGIVSAKITDVEITTEALN